VELFPGNYQDFEEIWKTRLATADSLAGNRLEKKDPQAPKSVSRKSQEARRQEAEQRNALFRRQAPLKKQIEELEERLSTVFAEKKKMESLLAEPDTYKDTSKFEGLMQAYAGIEKEVNALTAAWEDALLKMEMTEEPG
jgi:ATP-binding cassette, subfamily F, member 3